MKTTTEAQPEAQPKHSGRTGRPVGRPRIYDEPSRQERVHMPQSLYAWFERRAVDICWRTGNTKATTVDQEIVKALFLFVRNGGSDGRQ